MLPSLSFHTCFKLCVLTLLQFQTLLWLTCPTAGSITRPRSPGDCLMTTSPQITTCLSTAGGCKHDCVDQLRRCWWNKKNISDTIFYFSRLGGPSQSPSQEDGEDNGVWRATDRVYGPSAVVCDLEPDSLYSFRVRSCRNSMFSPYSPEVTFHTPPAPGRPDTCVFYSVAHLHFPPLIDIKFDCILFLKLS